MSTLMKILTGILGILAVIACVASAQTVFLLISLWNTTVPLIPACRPERLSRLLSD